MSNEIENNFEEESNESKVIKPINYTHWIDAIMTVAKHYRLEVSKENISLTSNWLNNKPISDVLRGLARQAGMSVMVIPFTDQDLSVWRFPLVVQFKTGQVAVIDSMTSDGQVGIIYSGDSGLKSSINAIELLDNVDVAVVMRPAQTIPDSRVDDVIKPHDKDWFKKLVLRDWKPYTHVFIATFVINLLALTGILFTRQVYDRVVPAESYPTLYVLFSGVMIAIIFSFILRQVRTRVIDLLGKRADLRISDRVFEHALRIKNTHRPKSTGTFISQIRDLDSVREMLTSTTVTAFADVPFFLLFCLVFWYIAGSLVLIPMIAVVLMVIPGLFAQKKLRQLSNEATRESSLRNAILIEAVQGNEDIKTLQSEQRFLRQWNHYNIVSTDVNLRLRSLVSTLMSWTQSVQTATFILIVLFGAPMIINGDLSTGSLIAASILGGRMIGPMAGLTQVLSRWQQAKSALAGINDLMALPVDDPDGKKRIHKAAIAGDYSIQKADFFYGEDNPLPALSIKKLTIKPGEKIAILGRNGAGKSTLLQVLSGLLEPKNGVVSLDGVSMSHIDPADVRRDIGLMGQNSCLFHGTLRENLTLGAPHVDDDHLLKILNMTGVSDFIRRIPTGLDYIISEGGKGLSGGQKQALLLARILIKNPHIILLDEPTAALDDVTEKHLIQELNSWIEGKTFVVATHKMSIVEMVDRIIVIDKGQVVLDEEKDTALAMLSGKNKR